MTDNVKKVFDLLGVEPDEEFNILLDDSSTPLKCKIDYKLQGYYLMFSSIWRVFDDLVKNLLNGTLTITKLPKKKKLRDLTNDEYTKWKIKNCDNLDGSYESCANCMFRCSNCGNRESGWVNNKELYSDKFLDQEIEMED